MAALTSMAFPLSIQQAPCRKLSTCSLPRPAKLVVRSHLGSEQQCSPLTKLEQAAQKCTAVLPVLAMNAILALPALAEEQKGVLFDFNVTLPIMAVEFLLLMFALNKVWFEPVSKVMDGRDEEIRKKLSGVRDNSDEIKQLQFEAEAVLKAARAETAGQAAKMKKELAEELDAKLQTTRRKIESELETALANLERQKDDTLRSLDSQVQTLSDDIVKKLIPFKA